MTTENTPDEAPHEPHEPNAPNEPQKAQKAKEAPKPDAPNEPIDLLTAKLDSLPVTPGCYLFLDKAGAVVYVGKAKSLRSRVRSYFQESGSDTRYFIPLLRRIVRDLETVVTGSEKEAAVLENQLIKQHRPRFNVKLRDDKDFLCLRIDPKQEWPRLETVRRPSPDGARYFGPYHSAASARRTLHLVNKHFQLRTCSDAELASRNRPCLQYQIKRCPAPCVIDVDKAYYGEMVRSVGLFLEGRHDELTGELTSRMRDAARTMEFEKAAIYRDQLKAVEVAREGQRVVAIKDIDQDVLGLYREGSVVEVELLEIRKGRVTETFSFSLSQMELPDEEVLGGFMNQFYGELAEGARIPDEIIVPVLPDGAEGTAEWLGDLRGRKVSIAVPQRGPRVELLKLANENAAHAFREKQRASDDIEARLAELRDRLRLPDLPHRIECCDISHLGGGDTVGSIVSLVDGRPDKKRYWSFHVKSTSEGDDYGAMYEVLARRFRRGRGAIPNANANTTENTAENAEEIPDELSAEDLPDDAEQAAPTPPPKPLPRPPEPALAEVREATSRAATATTTPRALQTPHNQAKTTKTSSETDWELPDLLVVDGGRGQLNVALSAARDLGLHDLPIVGLAKERESPTSGEKMVDRVYLPGQKNGIPLRSASSALFFLARARDEAHRFANHARKKLGKSRRLRSEIEDIRGIGPDAKKNLLRELGSMAAVRKATDEQILAVSGISRRHLTALRKVIPGPEITAEAKDKPPAPAPRGPEKTGAAQPPKNEAPQNEPDSPENH